MKSKLTSRICIIFVVCVLTTACELFAEKEEDRESLPVFVESQVFTDGSNVFVIDPDHRLWGAGSNESKILSNSDEDYFDEPVLCNNQTWASVASGSDVAFGIDLSGNLWVWGTCASNNRFDEFGRSPVPTRILDGRRVAKIDLDSNIATVLMADGRLLNLGYIYGEIGNSGVGENGEYLDESEDWIDVAVGDGYTLAQKSDGSLWAVGDDYSGQLGLGASGKITSFQKIESDQGWVSFDAGTSTSAGIKDDGTIWIWGGYRSSVLWDGPNSYDVPVQYGNDTDWSKVVAGYYSVLALKNDGTLWGVGENYDSTLGLGDEEVCESFVQIGSDNDWEDIDCSGSSAVGVKADGSVWTWGSNYGGKLGLGMNSDGQILLPVESDVQFKDFAVGDDFCIAIDTAGNVWTWGANDDGQIGNGLRGRESVFDVYEPVNVINNGTAVSCSATNSSAVVIDSSGLATGMGDIISLYHQSASYPSHYSSPTPLTTDGQWSLIDLDYGMGLGIKTDLSLWVWGHRETCNAVLDSPLNEFSYYHEPVEIENGTQWLYASASAANCAAIKADGTLWAWGHNPGDGTFDDKDAPVQVGSDSDWNRVETNDYLTIALKNNGTLWSWGQSSLGMLGQGSVTEASTPAQIGTDSDWVSCTIDNDIVFAVKDDGTLWFWGFDWMAGPGQYKMFPEQMGADNDWSDVECKNRDLFVLKNDGSLWSLGSNSSGKLGRGDTRSPQESLFPNLGISL